MKKLNMTAGWLTVVIMTLSLAACQQQPKDSKDVAEDKNQEKFEKSESKENAQLVVDLVSSQYREIRLSKYALVKSNNAEVKKAAGMMVMDHGAMLNDLKALATTKNISVPNEDSIEVNNKIDSWKDEKPADFNKAWVSGMIDSHKATVDKLEKALEDNDTDMDVKNLINSALPTVRKHLEMLNTLSDQLKAKS